MRVVSMALSVTDESVRAAPSVGLSLTIGSNGKMSLSAAGSALAAVMSHLLMVTACTHSGAFQAVSQDLPQYQCIFAASKCLPDKETKRGCIVACALLPAVST